MVHDYFEEAGRSHAASHHTERGEYDKLLPWYHLVEEARELAVFAPKEEVLAGLRKRIDRSIQCATLEDPAALKETATEAA